MKRFFVSLFSLLFWKRSLNVGHLQKSDKRRWFSFGSLPSLASRLSWTAAGLISCKSDYSLPALGADLTLQAQAHIPDVREWAYVTRMATHTQRGGLKKWALARQSDLPRGASGPAGEPAASITCPSSGQSPGGGLPRTLTAHRGDVCSSQGKSFPERRTGFIFIFIIAQTMHFQSDSLVNCYQGVPTMQTAW